MSDGFLWGVSTSPYQHEGGYNGEGQPRNNWYDGKKKEAEDYAEFYKRLQDGLDAYLS